MFSRQQVFPLFPTHVWSLQLADHDELDRGLEAVIAGIVKEEDFFAEGRAWQSGDDLHKRPEMAPFASAAETGAKLVLDNMGCIYEGFYLTGCWANINRGGYTHRAHVHQNNYLSGVYYLRTPAGCGGIEFQDPRPQANVIAPRQRPTRVNQHPGNSIEIRPQQGTLLIFPSWLQHLVTPGETNEARTSIAFNAMLKGAVGFDKAAAEL